MNKGHSNSRDVNDRGAFYTARDVMIRDVITSHPPMVLYRERIMKRYCPLPPQMLFPVYISNLTNITTFFSSIASDT